MTKSNISEELANKIIKIREVKTVQESDVEEIKDLIVKGAGVNAYCINGIPILHCIMSKEIHPVVLMEKIAEMVINSGFDIRFCDDKGNCIVLCCGNRKQYFCKTSPRCRRRYKYTESQRLDRTSLSCRK